MFQQSTSIICTTWVRSGNVKTIWYYMKAKYVNTFSDGTVPKNDASTLTWWRIKCYRCHSCNLSENIISLWVLKWISTRSLHFRCEMIWYDTCVPAYTFTPLRGTYIIRVLVYSSMRAGRFSCACAGSLEAGRCHATTPTAATLHVLSCCLERRLVWGAAGMVSWAANSRTYPVSLKLHMLHSKNHTRDDELRPTRT